MSYTELLRPYPIAVKPLHRETLDSYSARLLNANFETADHRTQLERLARTQHPELKANARWELIAESKAGRSLRAQSTPTPALSHTDGSSCPACTKGIPRQYLCTHCSHGETVQQHPHLDGNVCLTHHRWVGPGTHAGDQAAVDDDVLQADLDFRKLRRRNLIDAPFFLLLRNWLESTEPQSLGPVVYGRLVRLASALTSYDFGLIFFNPLTEFSDSFAFLDATLTEVLGAPNPAFTADLWLRFRPTFLSLRESIETDRPYVQVGPHDLPINPGVATRFRAHQAPLEAFANYIGALPEGTPTIQNGVDLARVHLDTPSDSNTRGSIATICPDGHRCSWVFKAGDTTCPVCTHRMVKPGVNDLASLFPEIAAEWDHQKNSNHDITKVAPGSNILAWWTCPVGHGYRKTVGNRTRGANCHQCPRIAKSARKISIAREDLAAEFDLAANYPLTPETVTIGSRRDCIWNCPLGHQYSQVPERRNAGYGCPFCSGQRFERGINDFEKMFPTLATEWDYAGNGVIEPSDHVARSRKVAWKCVASGHQYQQTIQLRIKSNGCPMCDPAARIGKLPTAS